MFSPQPLRCGSVGGVVPGSTLRSGHYFHPEAAHLPEVDRSQYVEGYGAGYGFPEAGDFLERELTQGGRNAQVILIHISDYERLKAYMPSSLHSSLRQVHIVDRQSRDIAEQIALVRSWLPQAASTYILVGSSGQWSSAWQQAFPRVTIVQSFSKPGGKDAVELRRVPGTLREMQ